MPKVCLGNNWFLHLSQFKESEKVCASSKVVFGDISEICIRKTFSNTFIHISVSLVFLLNKGRDFYHWVWKKWRTIKLDHHPSFFFFSLHSLQISTKGSKNGMDVNLWQNSYCVCPHLTIKWLCENSSLYCSLIGKAFENQKGFYELQKGVMANCLNSCEGILPLIQRTQCCDVRNWNAFHTGC